MEKSAAASMLADEVENVLMVASCMEELATTTMVEVVN